MNDLVQIVSKGYQKQLKKVGRGSSGTDSTGSAKPVNFCERVLEPVNFRRRKTEKDKNSDKMIEKGLILPITNSFNLFFIK